MKTVIDIAGVRMLMIMELYGMGIGFICGVYRTVLKILWFSYTEAF